MSSVLPFPKQRSLAHVLLDLQQVKKANEETYRRSREAYEAGDNAEEDRQADIGADLDRRESDLQDEAKRIIKAALGVTWDQIYEGLA